MMYINVFLIIFTVLFYTVLGLQYMLYVTLYKTKMCMYWDTVKYVT